MLTLLTCALQPIAVPTAVRAMLRVRCRLEHGNPKGRETLPTLTPAVLLTRLHHTAPDRQKLNAHPRKPSSGGGSG